MNTTEIATIVIPAAESAEAEPRLMDHSYDGIHEYDNPLPGWWRFIFAASIAFAAAYYIAYQLTGWGKTPDQNYRVALIQYQQTGHGGGDSHAASASEATLKEGAHDSATMAHGAEVFAAKCVGCHTADGHGLIGPNLTDLYQLHGTTRVDLLATIRDGAPGTPMIAWGDQLPAIDVVSVATFVASLRGQNLPGKAPQGQKVEPL